MILESSDSSSPYTTSTMSTSRAKRIGSLLFCPACGTLLDLPRDDQDEIECHQCGRKEPASCECPQTNPPSSSPHECHEVRSTITICLHLFRESSRISRNGTLRPAPGAVGAFPSVAETWKTAELTCPAYENLPTKTYSSPHAFPSALRSKRALVQNTMTGDEAAVDRDPVVSIVGGFPLSERDASCCAPLGYLRVYSVTC